MQCISIVLASVKYFIIIYRTILKKHANIHSASCFFSGFDRRRSDCDRDTDGDRLRTIQTQIYGDRIVINRYAPIIGHILHDIHFQKSYFAAAFRCWRTMHELGSQRSEETTKRRKLGNAVAVFL